MCFNSKQNKELSDPCLKHCNKTSQKYLQNGLFPSHNYNTSY